MKEEVHDKTLAFSTLAVKTIENAKKR